MGCMRTTYGLIRGLVLVTTGSIRATLPANGRLLHRVSRFTGFEILTSCGHRIILSGPTTPENRDQEIDSTYG